MQVTVQLVGVFRLGRFKEQPREFKTGLSVQDVIDELTIPPHLLGIVLINGCHAAIDDQLHAGDTLSLLPLIDGG